MSDGPSHFWGENVPQEGSLPGPCSWIFFAHGVCNIPSLPDWMEWADVMEGKMFCRQPGPMPKRALKVITNILNWTGSRVALSAACATEVLHAEHFGCPRLLLGAHFASAETSDTFQG